MKKALLPVALAAALPMTAMAEISLYGRAHVSLDYLDNGAEYSEFNVSSNSSRFGIRASKEIGDLTAIMQVEQQVDYDSGEAFTSSRDTYVGLRGWFGMVRVGQFDSPFKAAREPANLFGDQLGDMRNMTRVGDARFDERNPNSIHYQTPTFANAQFNIAYSANEKDTATDGLSDDALSLSVTYAAGPVNVALAYETYGKEHSRGERDGVRVAVSYDATSKLKLVGFFQTVDYDEGDVEVRDALSSDVFGVGAEFKLGADTTLRGHYFHRSADATKTDSDLFTIGVEHRLDKALSVYVNIAAVDNDKNVGLNPYNEARSVNVPSANDETSAGLSLGLRYDF